MSKRHPVVAVTGSSGAGTSTVKRAFEHIFAKQMQTRLIKLLHKGFRIFQIVFFEC